MTIQKVVQSNLRGKQGPKGETGDVTPEAIAAKEAAEAAAAEAIATLDNTVRKGELIVYAKDLGVVGDGIVDDTVSAQAALDYGATNNRIIYFGDLIVKISGALTVNGPGLKFSKASYGSSGDCGFYVTGAGYTALTVSPGIKHIACTVYGTGNTANGILLQNNLLSHHGKIRVNNLNGFGLKINKMWDSLLPDVSIEQCGNVDEYAFSMNDDGDTCNMSHILRLQVERSNVKAMYVSPNTLSCIFDNIHTEQTTGDGTNITHDLMGNSCTYNNLRVEGGLNEKVRLGSASGSYIDVRATSADVIFGYGVIGTPTYIRNLICENLTLNNISYETLDNCVVSGDTTIEYDTTRTVFRSCVLNNVSISGNGSLAILTDKTLVNGAITSSGMVTLEVRDSTITSIGATTTCHLYNAVVTGPYSTGYNCPTYAYNTLFNGNVSLDGDGGHFIGRGCEFKGNLGVIGGVGAGCLDSGCTIDNGKTVNNQWYLYPTVFSPGTKCYNPLPTAGGYSGYINIGGVVKGFGLIQS